MKRFMLLVLGAAMLVACVTPNDELETNETEQEIAAPIEACATDTATITVTGTSSTIMPCSQTATLNDRVYTITVTGTIVYIDAAGVQQTAAFTDTQTVTVGAGAGNGFNFTFPVPVCGTIVSVQAAARVKIILGYGIHGTMELTYDGSATGQPNTVVIGTDRTGATCVIPGATQLFGLWPNNLDNNPPPPPPVVPPPPAPQCNYAQDTHYGQSQQSCCLACVGSGASGMSFWASYACQYLGYCQNGNSSCTCTY